MAADEELAIQRGIPLSEEPGLGALTLGGFLRDLRERHGPSEALVFHHPDGRREAWSYDELWARAIEVARALVACGTGKDSRVGVLMTNRLEWVSSCFGIALVGGTVVGLSTFSTPAELDHLIKVSGLSVLLFERRVLAKDFVAILRDLEPAVANAAPGALRSTAYPFLRTLAVVGEGEGAVESWDAFLARGQAVAPERVEARAAAVKPSDPALLLFSSGSTGKPKGILNAHRGVNIQSWRWARTYDFAGATGNGPPRTWS